MLFISRVLQEQVCCSRGADCIGSCKLWSSLTEGYASGPVLLSPSPSLSRWFREGGFKKTHTSYDKPRSTLDWECLIQPSATALMPRLRNISSEVSHACHLFVSKESCWFFQGTVTILASSDALWHLYGYVFCLFTHVINDEVLPI